MCVAYTDLVSMPDACHAAGKPLRDVALMSEHDSSAATRLLPSSGDLGEAGAVPAAVAHPPAIELQSRAGGGGSEW